MFHQSLLEMDEVYRKRVMDSVADESRNAVERNQSLRAELAAREGGIKIVLDKHAAIEAAHRKLLVRAASGPCVCALGGAPREMRDGCSVHARTSWWPQVDHSVVTEEAASASPLRCHVMRLRVTCACVCVTELSARSGALRRAVRSAEAVCVLPSLLRERGLLNRGTQARSAAADELAASRARVAELEVSPCACLVRGCVTPSHHVCPRPQRELAAARATGHVTASDASRASPVRASPAGRARDRVVAAARAEVCARAVCDPVTQMCPAHTGGGVDGGSVHCWCAEAPVCGVVLWRLRMRAVYPPGLYRVHA